MTNLLNKVQSILSVRLMSAMIVIMMMLSSTGCTVVGFTVGAAMDASQTDTKIVKAGFHEKKLKNKKVSIALKDGTIVEGISEGQVNLSDSVYLNLFKENDSNKIVSPNPGEQIAIITGFKDSLEGRFLGYDQIAKPKRRFVTGSSSYGSFSSIVCRFHETDKGQPMDIYLHRIKSINSTDSTVYSPALIRKLATENRLPLLKALEVSSGSEKRRVHYSDIASLEYPTKKNSKWKLMALGAAIDVATLVVFALTWDMGSMGYGGGSY